MPELLSARPRWPHHVKARRAAPLGEEYTGPVLLEGQASAELLRQTLAPLMLARRPPDAENPRFGQGQGQATPFLTRIGLRVLSDSFSVSDTPSLKQFDGRPVAGSYVVDDEAVPAKDVTLVEKGRLVTLLTSRTPQKNLLQSNGHGRSGDVQAGVFQVRSTQAIPASELKAKYLELLKAQDKPFGYIVRGIAAPGDVAGGGPGGPIVLDAVKVTPDGREELGPRPALWQRAVHGVPGHPRGLRRAHAPQLPRGFGHGRLDHRAEPDLRGARASADARDRPETAGRAAARSISPYVARGF